ncbi:MAG: transcription antitermination protein NusB [Candidatus Borkfalkiaceae bacterium]|nr:transcription antitermination protein NusB [Clostridia bacterium]MDY6224013.1 transcription antitermination protein NusB [Christensenellaceae bacterium]
MRNDCREAVMCVLFARQFNSEGCTKAFIDGIYKKFNLVREEDLAFADKLLSLVGQHHAEIIEKIESASHHYLENRIFPLDKCVLMIAVAEILYFDDKEIPPVVSVAEATNLAKKYSGDTAADFVNGVLSGIINKKTA